MSDEEKDLSGETSNGSEVLKTVKVENAEIIAIDEDSSLNTGEISGLRCLLSCSWIMQAKL